MVIINTNAMEASIHAVSPELICELRITEGSVLEAAGGAAAVVGAELAGAPAAAAAGASGAEAGAADVGAVAASGAVGAVP